MAFTLELATAKDLPNMAIIMSKALEKDSLFRGMMGTTSHEDELKYLESNFAGRFRVAELGCSQTWKVVDEDGKMVAWAGLGIPTSLTEEEFSSVTPKYELPVTRNEALFNWFHENVFKSAARFGYDPTKHCQRQTTMVLPGYQRKGIGRMITEKFNQIADAEGASTYVRARPKMASLVRKMGYEVQEKYEVDLADYGGEGKTACYAMRREPEAKNDLNATLD